MPRNVMILRHSGYRARGYVLYRALVYSVLLQALGIDEAPAFFKSVPLASAASSVPDSDVEPPNGDEVMPTDSDNHT